MNKLIELLRTETKEIAASFEKASIEGEGTPQEVADRREGVINRFLEKYFPFPFRIVKGNIIDSHGGRSNSIDCIVLSPSHPYTVDPVNGKASVILEDGVDFAIEVKPDLAQKTELERGLEQIRSVKCLRRVRTGLASKPEEIERARQIPAFIFSETTYANAKTLISNIVDYYVANAVPKAEQFDLIVVNNRLIAINNSEKSKFHRRDFEGIAVYETREDTLAYFLFLMNLLPRSEPDMDKNIMKIYLQDTPGYKEVIFEDLNKKLSTIETPQRDTVPE